jgi:hypothetical protein
MRRSNGAGLYTTLWTCVLLILLPAPVGAIVGWTGYTFGFGPLTTTLRDALFTDRCVCRPRAGQAGIDLRSPPR